MIEILYIYMRRNKRQNYLTIIVLLIFICSTLCNNALSYDEIKATDINDLAYKQEISIPIDLTLEEAKNQPIDVRVNFDHSCWAKDETIHSVRIGYRDGSGITEIDSQIYDLKSTGDSHIDSCSIVFLIPEETDGKEKYYVFYDGSETDGPNYIDHITWDDLPYFYEPISGQKIDIQYFKIVEDDFIVFGICQEGEVLGNGVSNALVRIKPENKIFDTTTIDQLIPFYMSYTIDHEMEYTGSSWASSVSKSVMVDGNLMIRFRIEGISPEGTIKTDNIYTYYYSPSTTNPKRMFVDVYHEVLENVDIAGTQERDPTYASLATFKARSATIDKMNIGDILTSLHYYSEDDSIIEYSIPSDPDTEKAEWILKASDDANLGKNAWVCMDDPTTGKVHALIFQSNEGFLENEYDGLEIKVSTKEHVKLPGLEADTGDVFATRNSYVNGAHNTKLDKGMIVDFSIEYINFLTEGYEAVDKEAQIFQKLDEDRPVLRGNESIEEEDDTEKYTLTATVHYAPSFPLGAMLSAVSGKNISFINAELYKSNSYTSSGSLGRLGLASMDLDFEGLSLVETISSVIGMFDWRNATIFKKIHFPDLEPGIYLVKIFRENPVIGKERKYIGFSTVELSGDTNVNINCLIEGKLEASISDQKDNSVENVRFSLLSDDVIISEELSDENGEVILPAPCYPLNPYKLQVVYDGFLVDENQMKFRLTNSIRSIQKSFDIELYDLELNIKDTLNLPPAVDVNPKLTSDDMLYETSISAEQIDSGKYKFTNLYPASYLLKMSYKSITLEKSITVNGDNKIDIDFPAEFDLKLSFVNSYGISINSGNILFNRDGEKLSNEINSDGEVFITIPPGIYDMVVTVDDNEIAKQSIDVMGDKDIKILTSEGSFLHSIIMILGVLLLGFSIFLFIWKRNLKTCIHLIAIALIVIALVMPWWSLSGDNGSISTSTNTLLVPGHIVTLTSSHSVIGGEISSGSDELTMILELLSILLILSCLVVFLGIIIKGKFEKISKILTIVGFIFMFLIIVLFLVTMSQVTKIGVGSFSGSGEIDVSLPGMQKSATILCGWGPASGFYLGIIATILIIGFTFLKIGRKIIGKIFG